MISMIHVLLVIMLLVSVMLFSIIRKNIEKSLHDNSSSIISTTITAIRIANLKNQCYVMIILTMILSSLIYLSTRVTYMLNEFVAMNEVSTEFNFIKCLVAWAFIEVACSLIQALDQKVRSGIKYKIRSTIELIMLKKNAELNLDKAKIASHEVTLNAITSGANACGDFVGALFNVIKSFVNACMSTIAIFQMIGIESSILILYMPIIMLIGLYIQTTEYKQNKKLRKENGHIGSLTSDMMKRSFQNRINEIHDDVINIHTLLSREQNSQRMYRENNRIRYAFLESFMIICNLGFLIWCIKMTKLNTGEIVATLTAIVRTTWGMWNMFHSVSAVQFPMAQYGNLEEWLTFYKKEESIADQSINSATTILENVSYLSNVIDTDIPFGDGHQTKIIIMRGKSGSGKSTFCVNLLVYCARNVLYAGGNTLNKIFMTQTPIIIKSKEQTVYQWFTDEIKENFCCDMIRNIICIKANILGLSSIVNSETLDKAFKAPSPGEAKRCEFLKRFMYVFYLIEIGQKNFNGYISILDEAVAGVDGENRNSMFTMINDLRQLGILIILIEHHEIPFNIIPENDCIYLGVKSEEKVAEETIIEPKQESGILAKCYEPFSLTEITKDDKHKNKKNTYLEVGVFVINETNQMVGSLCEPNDACL